MVGPKGLSKVVASLRVIAPELPFVIDCLELTEPEQAIQFDGFRIEAFKVNHNVTCYGYSLIIDRIGKFQLEKALALGIEKKYWNRLQKGEIIQLKEMTLVPEMVLGPARKGLKVTYCTDTRPTQGIVKNAMNADLFICEGMYGEPDKKAKARENKHMTFYEAAELAKRAQVERFWLTHYSPSLNRPEEFLPAVKKIFPAAETCRDGKSLELVFGGD